MNAVSSTEDEFLRIIFNASPAEVRAICARVLTVVKSANCSHKSKAHMD